MVWALIAGVNGCGPSAQRAHRVTPAIGLNIELNEQSLLNLAAISTLSGAQGQDANGWPTSDFTLVYDNRSTFGWEPENPEYRSAPIHDEHGRIVSDHVCRAGDRHSLQ